MTAIALSQHRLRKEPPEDILTPTSEYSDRILRRSAERGWGLSYIVANILSAQLRDHRAVLQPMGVQISLGKGWKYDYYEAITWLRAELSLIELPLRVFPNMDGAQPHTSSGVADTQGPAAFPVRLDFGRYWAPGAGQMPEYVCADATIERWPGLEVIWFLALNPQYLLAMDNERYPYLWVPGMRMGPRGAGMPSITRGNTGVMIHGRSMHDSHGGAIPVYGWSD
ncbi:MAG: hypothetical protein WBP12_01100 [Candidatus Saccharimonas sp.]